MHGFALLLFRRMDCVNYAWRRSRLPRTKLHLISARRERKRERELRSTLGPSSLSFFFRHNKECEAECSEITKHTLGFPRSIDRQTSLPMCVVRHCCPRREGALSRLLKGSLSCRQACALFTRTPVGYRGRLASARTRISLAYSNQTIIEMYEWHRHGNNCLVVSFRLNR